MSATEGKKPIQKTVEPGKRVVVKPKKQSSSNPGRTEKPIIIKENMKLTKTRNGYKAKRNEKFTIEQMVSAIRATDGIITEAAKLLDCERWTIYKYVNRYATVKREFEEANERMKDLAERRLFTLIDGGQLKAITFYLRTKARDRGYAEKYSIDPKDVDLRKLSQEQLDRVRKGEDLITVLVG